MGPRSLEEERGQEPCPRREGGCRSGRPPGGNFCSRGETERLTVEGACSSVPAGQKEQIAPRPPCKILKTSTEIGGSCGDGPCQEEEEEDDFWSFDQVARNFVDFLDLSGTS